LAPSSHTVRCSLILLNLVIFQPNLNLLLPLPLARVSYPHQHQPDRQADHVPEQHIPHRSTPKTQILVRRVLGLQGTLRESEARVQPLRPHGIPVLLLSRKEGGTTARSWAIVRQEAGSRRAKMLPGSASLDDGRPRLQQHQHDQPQTLVNPEPVDHSVEQG
jgi:hypothetical protein